MTHECGHIVSIKYAWSSMTCFFLLVFKLMLLIPKSCSDETERKLPRWVDIRVLTSEGKRGEKFSPCQFLAALEGRPVGQMTDSRLINASSACRQSKLIGAEVRQLMQLEALIGIGQRQRLGAALHHFFLRNLFIWFGFAAIATMYQYHCITWRISAGFPFV